MVQKTNSMTHSYPWTRLIPLILVIIVTGCSRSCSPGEPPRPLDITAKASDLNGYPLNPLLGAQINGALAPDISSLSCIPEDQGDVDDAHWYTWYTGKDSCTKYHVTKNTGNLLFGHVNWFPVTVQGRIYWEGHSVDEWGEDDDYTFDIATQDNALGSRGRTDGAGNALVHCEFDSDEAIDPLLNSDKVEDTFWWKQFKYDVDYRNLAKAGAFGPHDLLDGLEVIAIGLYSLDCYHPCGVELHPLYILAIHLHPDLRADRWVLFAFNNGNQGYCGTNRIGLDSNNGANAAYNGFDEQYSVLLPLPQGASGNAPELIRKDVRVLLGGGDPIDAVAPKYFNWSFLAGKGEKLDFRLRYPEQQKHGDHYVMMGDITLDWGGK